MISTRPSRASCFRQYLAIEIDSMLMMQKMSVLPR